MKSRLKNFIDLLNAQKLDGYLVTKDQNIRYLTGFPAEESWLLVTPRKTYYITDFRYILEAKKSLKKGITLKQYTKSVFATLFECAKALRVRRLGFDDQHISVSFYSKLKKSAPKGISLVAKNNLVEDLRVIKEKSEVSMIRKALRIHQEALKYLSRYVKSGITENGLLDKLENYVKNRGVGFSFSPIIASGTNSCYPHAKVTNRKLRRNDVVLIDAGIDVEGYKSDLTRMFFLGKIPNLVHEVNDKVRQAQLNAITAIKDGVATGDVDYEARNFLKKHKLAKYFGHSLGHGVGLEIHESPRLSPNNTDILKENMVVTVEPAVYLPGKFGIRIEDMVLVTKSGCEVLSDR